MAFADGMRGYIVGEGGIILRTDDGGATWKDQESGLTTNLFAVSVSSRDDAIAAGEQGRVLVTKDGGRTWELQPTITSAPLYAVAYQGGTNAWVAGRGGAILRRSSAVATVKISAPKIAPILRLGAAPRLKVHDSTGFDDGDIPRAVPKDRKPARP